MAQSQEIGELFAALSKAQAKMGVAVKDKVNPHFRSKYASPESLQKVYQLPLAENGLSVIQNIKTNEEGVFIETILGHETGQWISSEMKLLVDKPTMQGLGSAITYGRRYSLSSMLNLHSDEDDDGNEAAKTPSNKVAGSPKPQAGNFKVSEKQLKRMFAIQKKNNYSEDWIKATLKKKWNLESRNDLIKEQYDQICEYMEANPLPENVVEKAFAEKNPFDEGEK